MASPAVRTPSASVAPLTSASDIATKAEELYEKCASAPADTIWMQRDLSNLQICQDTKTLMKVVQQLVDTYLMKMLQMETTVCWKLRSRDDAQRLRSLTRDERDIYYIIDEAQSAGIWSRIIRMKTNLPQQTLNKCLKSMESKGLIKSIANVKNPARKMYLLAHITPDDEVSGGSWHANGDLDTVLIDTLARVICRFVENETWMRVPTGANMAAVEARRSAIAKKKASVQKSPADFDMEDSFKPPMGRPQTMLIPKDPSNTNFPTTGSILHFINSQQIIKNLTVREDDMEQLLEMMVLDGRLEKMGANGYRTVKDAKEDEEQMGSWNGFVDAPCGLCPVFEQCSDEGEITARTCEYFAEWLGTD